jgi:DNA-binding transcriptional LysR family regulator
VNDSSVAVEKDKEFTPREIEVFAAVMLHGTTTKAADSLDITQPAVSKMLMQFTEKAGFQLFRKSRQRLIPTPEAHMLYSEVKRVFESARGISRAARDIRELRGGRLVICAMPAFGSTLLPSIVAGFTRLHPSVSVAIDIRSSGTVMQRASRNQLDIGIGMTSSEQSPSIVRRAFTSSSPVCAMPAGHPLAKLKTVQVEDLDGVDFISMGSADPVRLQLDTLCDQKQVSRALKVEVTLSSTCVDLVACGAGVAVVDRLAAWMARDRGIEIREFKPSLKSELSIYRPWGVIASTAADAFAEYLIDTTRKYMSSVDEGIAKLSSPPRQMKAS